MANNEKLAIGIKDEDNVLYRFIPPAASDSNVGGIKASPKTTQTQEVKVDPTTNRLYVDDPTDDIANVTGNLTNLHTTNKQNLVSAINEVNDSQTNIKEDLNTKINVANSRIDGFTHLSEGSTTGDAELIDGRIGLDGSVYPNIGGAIRGQLADFDSEKANKTALINLEAVVNTKADKSEIKDLGLVIQNGILCVRYESGV